MGLGLTTEEKNYELSQKALYHKLDRLYENNGLYERGIYSNMHDYNRGAIDRFLDHTRPLRTVVNRSVEFYQSKLSVVPMTITSQSQQVVNAVNQVWVWSNFSAIKNVMLRYGALYGNIFIKIVSDGNGKVYFENIKPEYVSDITTDNRNYLSTIRLDIPIVDENDRQLMYTEFWSKSEGYYSIWQHQLGENAELNTLGTPVQSGWLAEMGIDFLPFVQIKMKDTGKKWGVGSCAHALDKIGEANKEASRLSDLIFRNNKNVWAITANNVDANGRPIPAKLSKESEDDLFSANGESFVKLPGNAELKSLVPDLHYDSALAILDSQMSECKQDLPELLYYDLKDSSNMSGKSIKLLMSAAVDRANEYLNNFIQGLIRANSIALTIGKFWGIFNLTGNYEDGSFDHQISTPELFPLSEDEKASTLKSYVDAGMALSTAMRLSGFSEEVIVKALEEKSNQDNTSMALSQASLGSALSQFNSGR